MPKMFSATFTVYFEAHDQATAERFAPLMSNRLTAAVRADKWTTDEKSVVIFNDGSVAPAPELDHLAALAWAPAPGCYQGMSQRLMNHIAGA